jgi:hypothetical protein
MNDYVTTTFRVLRSVGLYIWFYSRQIDTVVHHVCHLAVTNDVTLSAIQQRVSQFLNSPGSSSPKNSTLNLVVLYDQSLAISQVLLVDNWKPLAEFASEVRRFRSRL